MTDDTARAESQGLSFDADDGPATDHREFEAIPPDPRCPHCAAGDTRPFAGIDAIYCISVREQPIRASRAMAYFHAMGLCRSVIMYRPPAGKYVTLAIWRSHAALARHALAHGRERILALEDDVCFRAPLDILRSRVADALAHAPADWRGLYLGHFPYQMFGVAPGLARVRSGSTHAYVANRPLLEWLARTTPMDPTVSHIWGDSIDTAYANLPGMYALDPMLATQRVGGEARPDAEDDALRFGRFRLLPPRFWLVMLFGYLLSRQVAFVVKLGAPLHRTTLEIWRLRPRAAQLEAIIARDSGLFDEAWYLRHNPDVAAADVNPFRHFMVHGGREGRSPGALFDAAFYLAENPEVGAAGLNPLVHYIARGAAEGRDPNPFFDSAWYVATNPDISRTGENPLAHFARAGWRAVRNPSPRFDCAAYLAAHPEVGVAGLNPLAHFLESRERAPRS